MVRRGSSLIIGRRRRFVEQFGDRTDLWKHLVKLRKTRFWPKYPVTRRIDDVLFECDLEADLTGLAMYLGLYEPRTVAAMKRFLEKGDVFLDVGANVGYLSAIGASLVGPTGCVHSFEPVPKYFHKLSRLAEMNPRYAIVPNRLAVGDREGSFLIQTSTTSAGANTIVRGLLPDEEIDEEVQVPLIRLDSYIASARLTRISLIKIDTEGFEYLVLRGMADYLEGTAYRPVMIVEVDPAAYPLLGYSLADLSRLVQRFGYRAYGLNAIRRREVDLRTLKSITTVALVAGEGPPSP